MFLRPAIATVSLGRSEAGHSICKKIQQASAHNFEGVEIFYECLEHHARGLPGGLNESNLLLAAQTTRQCCDENDMEIICLQPFGFYEGLASPEAHQQSLTKLRFWFKLARILRVDLIQIPTNFLETGTTGNLDLIVADCREAAELGMQQEPVIRFAYEAVAWGNHIDTWEGSWEVVKQVDMPNFGLCLDSFHIAGRVWGDPTSASGCNPRANQDLRASMAKMRDELEVQKIFYVQAGDAQRLGSPLSKDLNALEGQPPRMRWSRTSRLFPFESERGGYLPVEEVLETIITKLGYCGWVSMETFNQDLYSENDSVPKAYAFRGERSWKKLLTAVSVYDKVTGSGKEFLSSPTHIIKS